jgi:hypothetical protein
MNTVRHHDVPSFSAVLACFLAVGLAAPVAAHAQTRTEETASTTTNYTGTATITYTGKWHMTEITRNWSGGTAAVSIWGPSGSPSPSDPGVPAARATLTFTGTGVRWIGARGPQTGIANVFLDDDFVQSVDTFASNPPEHPEQIQATLFSRSGLADGPHTLTIEVTGTKNPGSAGSAIVVDAFDIEGNPSSRIQETGAAAVTYFGTWILGDNNAGHGWSGGTAGYSYAEDTPGIEPVGTPEGGGDMRVTTRAVFTFSGTGVAWIGSRHPQGGVANVYVDGQFRQQVDVRAGAEQSQQTLFTSGPLTPGIHTLAIEVMETRSDNSLLGILQPPSRGVIIVDAFDVTP